MPKDSQVMNKMIFGLVLPAFALLAKIQSSDGTINDILLQVISIIDPLKVSLANLIRQVHSSFCFS